MDHSQFEKINLTQPPKSTSAPSLTGHATASPDVVHGTQTAPESYLINDFAWHSMYHVEKPTVGRIVHYVSDNIRGHDDGHRAAIVIEAFGSMVADLDVFALVGMPNFKAASVTYDPTGQRSNSWHWPERI